MLKQKKLIFGLLFCGFFAQEAFAHPACNATAGIRGSSQRESYHSTMMNQRILCWVTTISLSSLVNQSDLYRGHPGENLSFHQWKKFGREDRVIPKVRKKRGTFPSIRMTSFQPKKDKSSQASTLSSEGLIPVTETEALKSKKSLIELLVSENQRDNLVGTESLYLLLSRELPWVQRAGKRSFLMPHLIRFVNDVRGGSEDHFMEYFNWLLNEVQQNRHFFAGGGPREQKKSRSWRRGVSDKALERADGWVPMMELDRDSEDVQLEGQSKAEPQGLLENQGDAREDFSECDDESDFEDDSDSLVSRAEVQDPKISYWEERADRYLSSLDENEVRIRF